MAKRPVKKQSKVNCAIANWKQCTGVQVAAICGVTPQAVSKWHGCPRGRNGKYDLSKVFAWRQRQLQDELELEADGSGADSPALERYRAARADRAELEVLEKRDALVSRVDVEARWGRVLTHIVQAFDGLGKVVAPRLARRDEKEIAGTIRDEVHRAIETARNSMLQDGEI